MEPTSKHTERIPCTIAILTHNSASTLPRALESVQDFAEIVICDGGSTDNTLEIANSYGAKIIKQSGEFLDEAGRIKNFSGVRNQTLEAAAYEWFFFLDSDEYLSGELVDEIGSVISADSSGAYWVPRKYVYNGNVIDNASTYPNQQMRFFSRACALQFIKEVHERIELIEGTKATYLTAPMFVPLPGSAKEMMLKWRRYVDIEVGRHNVLAFRTWVQIAFHEIAIGVLYGIRTVRISLFSRGSRLPVSFELARIWYQCALVGALLFRVRSL